MRLEAAWHQVHESQKILSRRDEETIPRLYTSKGDGTRLHWPGALARLYGKNRMDERKGKASRAIHTASVLAGAVGFMTPIPGSDSLLIAPIQAGLVIRLGMVYGVRPAKAALKSAGYAALGGVVGKGSARLVASFIPGFGSVVRAGVAASVTEAVGWAVLDNLEQGEPL